MARLYVGNLDPRVTARELEDEFRTFGVLRRSVLSPQIPRFRVIGVARLGNSCVFSSVRPFGISDDNQKGKIC
jgi:RNA recognition motif-containing protein